MNSHLFVYFCLSIDPSQHFSLFQGKSSEVLSREGYACGEELWNILWHFSFYHKKDCQNER